MVIAPRLIPASNEEGHEGEINSCRFTRDGQFVLTAGWDGKLILWEAETGRPMTDLIVSMKPLTVCAPLPDNSTWLVGDMDGKLYRFDAVSHELQSQQLLHTRPISAIEFPPSGRWCATASWDRSLILQTLVESLETYHIHSHADLVTGCRFSPDGSLLLSWSHDRSLRLWDVESRQSVCELNDHSSNITCANFSPDGAELISSGRDGLVLVHDLKSNTVIGAVEQSAEVCGCWPSLDGKWVFTLDVEGRLLMFHFEGLSPQKQLSTQLSVLSGDYSPLGDKVALGCKDGQLRFVNLDGLENQPIAVMPTGTTQQQREGIDRWIRRSKTTEVLDFTCPVCLQPFSVSPSTVDTCGPCPNCKSPLRFTSPSEFLSTAANVAK